MSDNKDQTKENNKERLQKQSEKQVTGQTENNRQKDGYTKDVAVDPAQKVMQTDSTKVQDPGRNLAKGGNNMPLKKK